MQDPIIHVSNRLTLTDVRMKKKATNLNPLVVRC